MRKNVKKYIIFSIVILLLISVAGYRSLILRRSAGQIRTYLLKNSPVGTSIGEVKELIKRENYELKSLWEKHGYSFGYTIDKTDSRIGSKYMRVHLGKYREIFSVYVTVFYIFDANDKLIEIDVWKDVDTW